MLRGSGGGEGGTPLTREHLAAAGLTPEHDSAVAAAPARGNYIQVLFFCPSFKGGCQWLIVFVIYVATSEPNVLLL